MSIICFSGSYTRRSQPFRRGNDNSWTSQYSFLHVTIRNDLVVHIDNDFYVGNEWTNQSESRAPARCAPPVERAPLTTTQDESEECPICLEVLQGDATYLLCRHSFHTHCLHSWLLYSQICPMCRAPITRQH